MMQKIKRSNIVLFGKVALMFLLAFALSSCSTNKKDNDWVKRNLNGKVKYLTKNSYEASEHFGNVEKGKREKMFLLDYDVKIKYDKNGNVIKSIRYNSDGSLIDRCTIKYNESGNEIERNIYHSDGSLDRPSSYDEHSNQLLGNIYSSDGSLHKKETYKYNENGNQIEKNIYNSEDNLHKKEIYEYNENGNQIEKSIYNSDGSLNRREIYKYNENGNQIERNRYDSEGSIISKKNYKYDENGNNIEWKWDYFGIDNLPITLAYKYNEHNNLIEVKEYNSDGNLKKKETYKYDYDKMGNWIKQKIYVNKKAKFLIERKLEYYK